ncbi:MAG: LamG-like jellyroll fold domain-containing protein, partial [Verrucomicrobiota bacterium]
TCSGATLAWSSVPFAAGYIIQRSTSSGAETNYATSAINSYTDSNVAIGTTYFYKIIATNSTQVSASSSEVSGTIQNQSPVTITAQPADQVVCAGDTATFSVAVSDGTGVSYLWQYSLNGGSTWTDIPTATTASYTTVPVADTDNGTQYRVLVINSCASVPSDAATLNVVSAVATLTKQPFDQTVVAGWPAVFSVKATGANLIYQSSENGGNLQNGNGDAVATTASLTLSNTTTASSGFTYDCVVGPSCYAVTSSPALLTVSQYASNNLVLQFDFEDAPNGTTTTDSVHGITLNLVDSGFASVDLHGQPGSGVAGVGRALDFSSGATMGASGPLAYAIGDGSVNYGAIGSFTLTLWANPTTPLSGFPRYFILGAPGTSDTSSPDAFGLLKSTGESLYINGTASDSLTLVEPANQWTYMAVTWDGQTVRYYSGSTNGSVTLLRSVTAANGPINVGNTANLLLGNNGTQNRAFAGKMDNVRLYLGAAPVETLETIRQAALPVVAPQIITGVTANGNGSVTLSFSANSFYTYQVQFATNLTPPVVWQTISTNTADANGLWQFTDTNAIPHAQGFYRSVYQP